MTEKSKDSVDLVDKTKAILDSRNLTLHQVSEESARLYGRSSLSFIQHNFYYALGSSGFGPSLLQLCALSRISGYRLHDWLNVFGFDLGEISSLQVLLPSRRTILLDAGSDDSRAWIPWFRDAPGSSPPTGVVPLSRLLAFSDSCRLDSLSVRDRPRFRYAKLGAEDALAFPDLLPGSIVRVDSKVPEGLMTRGRVSERIFLIEHGNGFWCSRLYFSAKNQIYPISNQLPYARVGLQIPSEAQVLGLVDMEIRRISKADWPEVPSELACQWKPAQLSRRGMGLGGLLRNARARTALSFREASSMSRRIADLLGDERYFAAPGSLSDYEAQAGAPRHIQKAITLCVVYAIPFGDFLNAIGAKPEGLGQDSMPSSLLADPGNAAPTEALDLSGRENPNLVLKGLMAQFEDIPFFLRGSLAQLSSAKKISLHDFFWIGSENNALHPYIRDGLLLIVNRHKKKPLRLRSMPFWQQPLYVLMMRDGRYLCAVCCIENDLLIVDLFLEGSHSPLKLRNRRDAEVIGQVDTIVRRVA